jgi:hypothetical protein
LFVAALRKEIPVSITHPALSSPELRLNGVAGRMPAAAPDRARKVELADLGVGHYAMEEGRPGLD